MSLLTEFLRIYFSEEEIDAVNLVCTSVTTIAATAVTLSLVHVLGVAGAYCCFKWRRRTKRKKILQRSLEHHGPPSSAQRAAPLHIPARKMDDHRSYYAKPEVSFRNVYGSYESPP